MDEFHLARTSGDLSGTPGMMEYYSGKQESGSFHHSREYSMLIGSFSHQ